MSVNIGDFAVRIVMDSDLSDLRYLYRYGEYVSANETGVAEFTQIDAMIADTTVNQQELISRLKFIARLGYKAEELPEFWFNKCVGYLQYIAYNQTDRDDAFIHQEYAAALEMVLRKLNGKAPIPACLSTEPAYGKKVYNMRPDALKMKPKRKK